MPLALAEGASGAAHGIWRQNHGEAWREPRPPDVATQNKNCGKTTNNRNQHSLGQISHYGTESSIVARLSETRSHDSESRATLGEFAEFFE